MIGDTAILNQDVYSIFGKQDKDRKPYAKRWEQVTIISESHPAVIVETKKGVRFAVNVNKITIKISHTNDNIEKESAKAS